jgi:hypothetical protein
MSSGTHRFMEERTWDICALVCLFMSDILPFYCLLLDITDLVGGTQITFAEKYWLLIWAQGWTKNRRGLAFLPLFCVCLCSRSFILQSLCSHLGFQKGQNWYQLSEKELKFLIRNSRNLQDRHPSKWGQLPIVMRLHAGAGAIISQEPDGSPQEMTTITSSLEPL